MSISSSLNPNPSSLTIHTDGGSRGNPGPAATGIAVLDDSGTIVHAFGKYLGITTNNVAEYTAVIDSLEWVVANHTAPFPVLQFKLDSNLVVQQLNRNFKIKQSHLAALADQIWTQMAKHHLQVTYSYVPRAQNHLADAQVNIVLDAQRSKATLLTV